MFRSFVAAIVAPLLLTACAPSPDLAPLAAVRAVPDRLAAVATGRVETTYAVGPTGGQVSFTSQARFDQEVERLALRLDLGELVDLDRSGPSLEIVVDGSAAFLRGSLIDAVAGSVGWRAAAAADLERVGSFLGLPGAGTDPLGLLERLGEVREAERAGKADVRGVPTRRYDARLDDRPIRVWIDVDGLPRRLELVLDRDAGDVTLTMELFDYGEPVVIDVPQPEEVIG